MPVIYYGKIIRKEISTDNDNFLFQVRVIKDEGIGLLTAKDEKNYLILDSAEYWYDSIQDGYPQKKKCSCKNDWFKVIFQYTYRNQNDDIKEVLVITTCSNCLKTSVSACININIRQQMNLLNILYRTVQNLK